MIDGKKMVHVEKRIDDLRKGRWRRNEEDTHTREKSILLSTLSKIDFLFMNIPTSTYWSLDFGSLDCFPALVKRFESRHESFEDAGDTWNGKNMMVRGKN